MYFKKLPSIFKTDKDLSYFDESSCVNFGILWQMQISSHNQQVEHTEGTTGVPSF